MPQQYTTVQRQRVRSFCVPQVDRFDFALRVSDAGRLLDVGVLGVYPSISATETMGADAGPLPYVVGAPAPESSASHSS